MKYILSKHVFKRLFRLSILMSTTSQLLSTSLHSKQEVSPVSSQDKALLTTQEPLTQSRQNEDQKLNLKLTDQDKATHQSLRRVITEALTNNPNLNADKAAKMESRYRVEQAKAGYLPTLDAQGSYGYGYLNRKLRATKLNSGSTGTFVSDTGDISLSARQMLFDGLDTPYKVEKAEAEKTQSAKKIHETLELVAFQAVREYFTILRFQELIRLAQKNIENHKSVLEKVRALVKGGKSTIADVEHVQGRLGDAEAALQDITGDLETSKARFVEIVGYEPTNLIPERVDYKILPPTLEAALKIADQTNRSLEVARASVEVAKADLKTTDTPFYPSLGLEGNAQKNYNPLGESGMQTTYTAKAVVRYNIFNGGRDRARQKEYNARLTEAKCKLEAQRRSTHRDVRVSNAELNSARKQYLALQGVSSTKKDILNTYKQQFDLGTRSLPEILDAAHDAFLAEGGMITAAAAADISAIRMLAVMGVLAETYGWSNHRRTKPLKNVAYTQKTQAPELISADKPLSMRARKGVRSVY